MIPGETVSSGAQLNACPYCGTVPALGVYMSAAGYYIGYGCCVPYSRESARYYRTRDEAESELAADSYARRSA